MDRRVFCYRGRQLLAISVLPVMLMFLPSFPKQHNKYHTVMDFARDA